MGTAADRTVRVLTAGIVAAALGMVGCGPYAAALPAGFPNLDSFSPVPILCLRAIRRHPLRWRNTRRGIGSDADRVVRDRQGGRHRNLGVPRGA